jgi:hypothetical protein
MTQSDVFALVGVCLLSVFGYAIWPPLALAVFGIAFLRVSYATAPHEAEPEVGDDE